MEGEDVFPTELQDRLTSFDNALSEIENVVNKVHATPLNEIHEKLEPLDKAKVDLLAGYTMNSLFWMYMSVTGENPKEHGIKQELDRIRGYMSRVKEIEDKAKAPKIDKAASKRFVRSALWQMAQGKSDPGKGEDADAAKAGLSPDAPQTSSSSNVSDNRGDKNSKRKSDHGGPSVSTDSQPSGGKKRKKNKKNKK